MLSGFLLHAIARMIVAGSCFVLVVLPGGVARAQQFLTRLDSPIPGGGFGQSGDISGDTVIAGARIEDTSGAAHVFEKDHGGIDSWGEVARLTAFGGPSGDLFGWEVAISGDTGIVTEHRGPFTPEFPYASMYIFQRDQVGPNAWGEVARLSPSGAIASGSVDIDGNTAIAGSRRANLGTGAAYVFERNEGGPNNWGQVVELSASDAFEDNNFGNVGIFSDTVIVGASGGQNRADVPGSAYIFERNEGGPGNWGEVKKFNASDADLRDEFGNRVDIVGDTAIVGASGNDDAGPDSGSAYIFQRNQGGPENWGEVVKLLASDASAGDAFGYRVAISEDFAIVGAPNEGDPINGDGVIEGSGAAYVFGRNVGGPNNWGEMLKITAPDAALERFLGVSVALSGNRALVGALGSSGSGLRGSLYLFELPAVGEPIEILRYPKTIYSSTDDGSASNFDDVGDTAKDLTKKTRVSVGEIDGENTNLINRLVAKFALPDVPQSMPALKSAVLSFFLEDITGPPPGPASLFHSTSDNDLDQLPSDFEDETYTDTNLDLVGPADEGGRYYALDVTDLVRADYAADGDNPLSAFRLQVNELMFTEDNQNSRYRFTMLGAEANHPQLVLTFVPEPSTWCLAVIATMWFAGRVRPRGYQRHNGVRRSCSA